MEASMSDPFLIIDTEDGPIIQELDYSTMTMEELEGYVMLGREGAMREMIKRDSRAGADTDPYAPVKLPEP